MTESPFEEDCAVLAMVERFGLQLDRRAAIEITDLAALEAAGLMQTRKSPDYAKIRRLLYDGIPVAGAALTGVEYVLRRKKD
jgi:hypothetical protein